ncbi:MAG: hypothetical protein ACLS9K_15070 [Lachnospira eligens]
MQKYTSVATNKDVATKCDEKATVDEDGTITAISATEANYYCNCYS